ncbi:MAG: hypothetical protein WBA28_06680 [Microbacteriaceae bacterium]
MRDFAYRVPFLVDRAQLPQLILLNVSEEPLHHLRFSLVGQGVLAIQHSGVLLPGESVTALIHGKELQCDTLLVLRWFRPSGHEYLWQVSF